MRQYINFDWAFVNGFDKGYLKSLPKDKRNVDIPHNAHDLPYNYLNEKDYQNIYTYEKVFDLEEENKNKEVLLHFEGFMLQADIYLNDTLLGHYISGYLPVTIDISEVVKAKDNRLVVILDSREDPNVPPFGYAVDYLTFSGIYREVYLEYRPKTYIEDLYVNGDMDGNTTIEYSLNKDKEHQVLFEVLYDDKLIYSSKEKVFKVQNISKWSIDKPKMYSLRMTLETEDGVDTKEVRFGYRSIKFTSKGFYLNNEHIKLHGLNRHQSYPYVGYAMPQSVQEDDALKLKDIGVNIVRTSHYPQSEHFLNKCDELGLLVVNEIPGWQHLSKDEKWRENYFDFVKRMVIKERNHPSLIAHGVRIDESKDDHDLYKKGNEIAHQFDRFRPTLGVRNFAKSELLENIYGYNDFSCDSLEKGVVNPNKITKDKKSPYLITENMGHMKPVKNTSDIELQKEVALRHFRILNDSYKYERISGTIGWCAFDYYTHVDFGSGDHICPHGVMDMFRNKKLSAYAFEVMQEDHPVLELLSNMRPGDFPEARYHSLYVATNCDRVDLYKNDKLVKSYYPNNKEFKFLKHPPIVIDDILGDTFDDDRFNAKERKKIAKLFSYAGINGFNHLTLKQILPCAGIYLRHRPSYDDLLDIWNTHISTWGGYAKTFTFKGIKNNKVVIKKRLMPSLKFKYEYTPNKLVLTNKDTYDVAQIKVRYTDSDSNLMNYANKPIRVLTEGPIELIGPELQTLLGGQITIYVRSLNKKGKAKVTIITESETKQIDLEVR